MGYLFFFFLMIRRPPRSTLFPYTNALPICRRVGARGGLVRRAALAAAVGGVARGGSVDQPPPAHRKDHTAVVRGCASPAINRPTDMAVLRDVRRPRRARPASR